MEITQTKPQAKKIMKRIMNALGYTNVVEFAKDLNVPYMQVYNCIAGRTKEIPFAVSSAVMNKFPNVSIDFLHNMEGEPLRTANVPKFQENEESKEPSMLTLTNQEIFNLLNRVTILLDKVQDAQTKMMNGMNRIDQLERNYRELIKAIKTEK